MIKKLTDETKVSLKEMNMLEEFKKYSTFNEFVASKLKASTEFNRKQLQIIYKNLKNILKNKIFGNLENIQRNIEARIKEVFPQEPPAFKRYKQVVAALEGNLLEVKMWQKEADGQHVLAFTRLSKLQNELMSLKKADQAFTALTEKCLKFNVETELNFQVLDELVVFNTQIEGKEVAENLRPKILGLFEREKDDGRINRMSTVQLPAHQNLSRFSTPNMIRKSSQYLMGTPVSQVKAQRYGDKSSSFVSLENEIPECVSAIAFIEAANGRKRTLENKTMSNKQMPVMQQRSSVLSVKASQPMQKISLTDKKPRSFKKQNDLTIKDSKQLFQVQNECAFVEKLNIDFLTFKCLLDKISECRVFITQIIFKDNLFEVNPIESLSSLFEGPLNESLTIDFRENTFTEGINFKSGELQSLQRMNVFVLF